MKVLQLNTYASGGSHEYAALLSEALLNEGIESRILCKASLPAKGATFFFNRLIRHASISFSREPWHGTRRLLPPPGPQELAEVDVVHLHTMADWFDVPRWLEALPERIGVVISLHDLWHVSGGCFLHRTDNRLVNNCRGCPVLRWPASAFLASFELARKQRVYRKRRAQLVANSHWLAEIAGQSPIAKACGGIRVIPPGIDTTIFKPQDKKLCREKLALPDDAFVIATGCTSLTDANKNVPWLLEQLSQFSDLQNVIVLVFGEGSVPAPYGLNVRFTGAIQTRRELASIFAAADVFVSASRLETYGLALVEAMACGTPAVAFRVGGIPEAVASNDDAILCEPLDGAALIAAISNLRDALQTPRKLGGTTRQIIRPQNEPSAFAQAFAEVYQHALEQEAKVSAAFTAKA
jgi:glycosyltransferase involved in cell wall biosynthesis